jgi:hypothetical protein
VVITIHRGWAPIAGIFVFLGAVETVAMHLLVAWWPLTVLSMLSVAWFVADAVALRMNPIVVEPDRLVIGVGLRWHAIVPREAIGAVERVSTLPVGAVDLKVLDPAVMITLRSPVTVRGLFGRTRSGDRLVVSADDPAQLVSALA